MQPAGATRPLSVWLYPLLVMALFVAGITTGMASGHWHSSLTYADYQRLIPQVQKLTH